MLATMVRAETMNTDQTELADYYARRAEIHEQVCGKPEPLADLKILKEHVCATLMNHHVLEIACGTGYWTEVLAQSAASVLATDGNQKMVELAQSRGLPSEKVRFAPADAFDLQLKEKFSACFAGFWWSHLKRQDQTDFLQKLHMNLGKDILLVLLDSVYVEGSSAPIARTDHEGNTCQIRTLPNGDRHELVKNFPTDSGLRKRLAAFLKDIRILRLEHYWMLTGRFK
jgi:SAM-dependent methyltransferase